ncbi:hypothetical protein H6F43_03110 [Leptolyngbya sp. FACHB-36]|uniref:hypothetical protein n=1 Tax=Leptolyngbya sp. FACHB-36 TaxID=2692808 RepID=UPI0016817DBA|nr:hypothetical protein [Leptolyngbya sp. FACHB-36]MBD2019173.1 hypothetical protein [Leptolyngbya sp. FACHB-36]
MPFTLEQRYAILTHLNLSLLRSAQMQSNYADYSGDFRRYDAVLSPTEYQANRPQPLLFKEADIWKRLNDLEAKSEFLVQSVVTIVDDLTDVETQLKAARKNPNYALFKTAELEWALAEKLSGLHLQRDEAIAQLRYHLNLPPMPAAQGGAATIRS